MIVYHYSHYKPTPKDAVSAMSPFAAIKGLSRSSSPDEHPSVCLTHKILRASLVIKCWSSLKDAGDATVEEGGKQGDY